MITGNEPINALGRIKLDPHDYFSTGLTIRQHFASMAMQGMLASFQGKVDVGVVARARYSVKQADALIAELNK